MKVKCPKCSYEITVYDKIRSLNENNYFYGVVLAELSEYTGHTAEELKIYLKKKFGWVEAKEVFGEMIEKERSTARMTTAEFEKFMTQIRMWATEELNLYIPMPNEKTNP